MRTRTVNPRDDARSVPYARAMGPKPRVEVAGGIFHITSRGNDRRRIFLDDHDYVGFLAILERAVARARWICHSYCLMPNHYHLMLETPEETLAIGMRHLNGSYAQRFNRRYEHVGHVFQGRYDSTLVETEQHFLELCRYVVLNPVRAGLCGRAADWPWSSFCATAGIEPPLPFLTTARLWTQFEGASGAACDRYANFVSEGSLIRRRPAA
jgi:REP-associated tyrosine transposase